MASDTRPEKRRISIIGQLAGGAAQRAVVVALVVGTILNLVNQGEAILGRASIEWSKLALTYVVPFFVSLHGALSARRCEQHADEP